MKRFHTKENEETAKEIIAALKEDGEVEVHNDYETFYGVSFDGWLKKKLEGIECTIEVTSYNRWEGYPWTYHIKMGKSPEPKKLIRKVKVLKIETIVDDYKTGEWVRKGKKIVLTEEQAKVLEEVFSQIQASEMRYYGLGAKDQENLSYLATPLVSQLTSKADKSKYNRFDIRQGAWVDDDEFVDIVEEDKK